MAAKLKGNFYEPNLWPTGLTNAGEPFAPDFVEPRGGHHVAHAVEVDAVAFGVDRQIVDAQLLGAGRDDREMPGIWTAAPDFDGD